jgi:hypothetical protein
MFRPIQKNNPCTFRIRRYIGIFMSLREREREGGEQEREQERARVREREREQEQEGEREEEGEQKREKEKDREKECGAIIFLNHPGKNENPLTTFERPV